MASQMFGQVIRKLQRVAIFDRRHELITAKCVQAGDENGPQTAVVGDLRNALNTVLRRNSHYVSKGLRALRCDPVESSARFVYQVGRNGLRFAEHGFGADRRLIARGKGSAFGYSFERPQKKKKKKRKTYPSE